MYEYGMSELVKTICESYASAMGGNFPPCVQQEINAMAVWIDTVTVKDFNVTSDGQNITFKVTTAREEKTFNISFPVSVMNTTIQDVGNGFTITVEKLDGSTTSVTIPITEYVTVTPASATSGSVTEAQLITLNKNGSNILVYNNRYYRRTVVYGSRMYYTAEDDGIMYQVIVDSSAKTWEYSEISYNSRIISESQRAQAAETTLSDQMVKITGDQTINGIKTFTEYIKTPQVANTDDKALVRYKDTEVKSVFGNDSSAAVLMGNTDRPYYSKSGSDFTGVELALKSDISGGGGVYRHFTRIVAGGSTYHIAFYSNTSVPFTLDSLKEYAMSLSLGRFWCDIVDSTYAFRKQGMLYPSNATTTLFYVAEAYGEELTLKGPITSVYGEGLHYL